MPQPAPDEFGNCPPGLILRQGRCRAPMAETPYNSAEEANVPGGIARVPQGNFIESPLADAAASPCPPGTCRDVMTNECRWYNPNREKPHVKLGHCRKRSVEGGGGGGGGGGGVAKGGAFPGMGDIWSQIQGLLNSPSRYSPEVMGRLTGEAKTREASQNYAARGAIDADLARRGIFRSPIGAALQQKARQPAAEAFNKSVSDLSLAKVNADAQDKMFAVQTAMQWLAQLQQGRQFDANIQLAYAQLAQQMKMLQTQLSDPFRLISPLF